MQVSTFVSIAALAFSHVVYCGEHIWEKYKFSNGNICGDTTWQNETAAGSPDASDCDDLMQDLRKYGDDGFHLLNWERHDDNMEYLGLANSGTCTFGINVIDANAAPAIISSGDMADIIRDAIRDFKDSNYNVGASGEMNCRANWGWYDSQRIGWRIYQA
ncbi:putative necrosis-inducing factor-domain-containing protein [Astrocystis sublimbata]|nr:putative necrosis-inducing factor-domain-containing protein [Astrocystis sublimbata]